MLQVDPVVMPVVKARPLGELVQPAAPTVQRTADRGAMDLPAPAAAPSPMTSLEVVQPTPLASPTVSPAASAPPSQLVQPIPEPMSETEMPTLIMPTPAAASQPVPAVTDHPLFSPTPEPLASNEEPLGLEAVWPVQRKATPVSRPEDTPLDPVEAAEPVRYEKPEAQKVQQVMRQVAAAKPTDSSVELILPRRQRPNVPTRPVQRQPENKGQSHDSGNGASTPQAYVPTEIGPLPGDLWELLGEKPPTSPQPGDGQMVMRTAAPPVSQPTPATASPPLAQRSWHPASPVQRQAVAPPPPAQTPSSGPTMIQRAETSAAASSSTATATTTATTKEGGEGEEAEEGNVNMDELARQVYREIKQRLAVEWERGRGRF